MGAKKWSEIKKLSKATEADRDEARAELEGEIRIAGGPWTIQQVFEQHGQLADKFEAFDPSEGREVPVPEYLDRRRRRAADDGG